MLRVLVFLSLLYIALDARADVCQLPYDSTLPTTSTSPTQTEAAALCQAQVGKIFKVGSWGSTFSYTRQSFRCIKNPTLKRFTLQSNLYKHQGQASGVCVTDTDDSIVGLGNWDFTTNTCEANSDPHTDWDPTGYTWDHDNNPATPEVNSSDRCFHGCTYTATLDLGTGVTTYRQSGTVCAPGTSAGAPASDTDSDGDGVLDNNDDFPDDPNETTDTDGDGVGDNGDTSPNDPDNGADDGGGDESDNLAGGGGTCSSQPTCSGDAIQCAILFQAWKTRCAVEGIDIADGQQDIDVTVNVEGGSSGGGDDDENGRPDWTEDDGAGSASGTAGASGGDVAVWHDQDGSALLGMLDDSGFLSHTCPAFPTVSLGWLGTFDAPPDVWCDLIEAVGAMVLVMGALVSIRILMD